MKATRLRKVIVYIQREMYIKNKLDDLKPLIIKSGTVKSERNSTDTDLYKCTIIGSVIGFALCIHDEDQNTVNVSKTMLQLSWMFLLDQYGVDLDRLIFIILVKTLFFAQGEEKFRLIEQITPLIISSLAVYKYDDLLKLLLMSKGYDPGFHKDFLNILSNSTKKEKKMLMFGFKHYIESSLFSL